MIIPQMKLIIDNEYHDFVKKNKIKAETPAIIKFNNCEYDIMYTNNQIIAENIVPRRIIAAKDKLIFPIKIYDKEFIEYICKNTIKIIVTINDKQVRYYPSFKTTLDNHNEIYLKDLVLIEY